MKILLIGGTGFIGRNILEILGRTYDIDAPNREHLDLLDTDAVASYIKHKSFEVVIYAANVGGKRNQQAMRGVYDMNYRMFLNVARNHADFGRMIFFGSGAEYGKQKQIVMVREDNFGAVRPEDEYGQAKYAASQYIAAHSTMMSLRCFAVFGKYEDYRIRFISNAICRALLGLPIRMHQNAKYDFLYVSDLITILEYFIINQSRSQFYNAGFGRPVELTELARMVQEETDSHLPIEREQQGYANEYSCDTSRLKNEIPHMRFTPYREAIREMVAYYKNIISSIRREDLEE